mmetsp:Transcript_84619/g.137170  ORF Transcript_84619/g.137170 Transcript_84619/m.137170 type:complete len:104 (+) Transcript_84619:644-955(+)
MTRSTRARRSTATRRKSPRVICIPAPSSLGKHYDTLLLEYLALSLPSLLLTSQHQEQQPEGDTADRIQSDTADQTQGDTARLASQQHIIEGAVQQAMAQRLDS